MFALGEWIRSIKFIILIPRDSAAGWFINLEVHS